MVFNVAALAFDTIERRAEDGIVKNGKKETEKACLLAPSVHSLVRSKLRERERESSCFVS